MIKLIVLASVSVALAYLYPKPGTGICILLFWLVYSKIMKPIESVTIITEEVSKKDG